MPIPLSGSRRHPGDADRRSREARSVIDLSSPEAIETADPSGMLRAVLDLPGQCREGYRLGRAVTRLPDATGLTSLVVCGMGGSGVAGAGPGGPFRDPAGKCP